MKNWHLFVCRIKKLSAIARWCIASIIKSLSISWLSMETSQWVQNNFSSLILHNKLGKETVAWNQSACHGHHNNSCNDNFKVSTLSSCCNIIILKLVHFLQVVMFNSALDNMIFLSLWEGLTCLLYSVYISVLY